MNRKSTILNGKFPYRHQFMLSYKHSLDNTVDVIAAVQNYLKQFIATE